MIEYTIITYQLAIFIFFSFFPINRSTSKYLPKSLQNLPVISYFLINLLLVMIFLLIASFTRLELETTFFILIIIYGLLFLLSIKDIFKFDFKKNFSLGLIFLLVNFALFTDIARDLELGWDALTLWKLKANHFYNGNNYFDITNFPHQQYPHLGTYIWAFFWKNSILNYEYLGRLFQTYLYVVSLFALVLSFKIKNFLKNFLIIVLLVILTYEPNLRGYQDVYIFSLIIFFGYFIFEKFKYDTELNDFIILIPIILPWIKNEGIFYSIFLTIIYFLLQKNLIKKFLFPITIFLLIAFQFYLNLNYFNLNSLFQFEINPSNVLNNQGILVVFEKIYKILFYSSHAFFKHPILIVDAIIILISIYYLKFDKSNIPYLIFLFLSISFIFGIYVLTPSDLKWHLQSSVDRLLLQTSGIYIYLLANLNEKKIFKI